MKLTKHSWKIDRLAKRARALMQEASRIVLKTHECSVGIEIIKYPDRFKDENGHEVFEQIVALVNEYENQSR